MEAGIDPITKSLITFANVSMKLTLPQFTPRNGLVYVEGASLAGCAAPNPFRQSGPALPALNGWRWLRRPGCGGPPNTDCGTSVRVGKTTNIHRNPLEWAPQATIYQEFCFAPTRKRLGVAVRTLAFM